MTAQRDDLQEFRFLPLRDGLTLRSMLETLKILARKSNRVWLVLSSWDRLSPLLVRELEPAYDQALHLRERGVETYLFVLKDTEASEARTVTRSVLQASR